MTLATIIGAALFGWTGKVEPRSLALGVVIAVVGIAFAANFVRRSRRITIGDSWISGPTRGSSETTTIPFSTIDRSQSGFRKGRFVVRAQGGHGISAKLAWYPPGDLEEIERLARERCGILSLPGEGQ